MAVAFGLKYVIDIVALPVGSGAMEVPTSQVLRFFPSVSNPAGLTGGSGAFAQAAPITAAAATGIPTAGEITTALNNLVTDLNAQITAAVLARIAAFASGGG